MIVRQTDYGAQAATGSLGAQTRPNRNLRGTRDMTSILTPQGLRFVVFTGCACKGRRGLTASARVLLTFAHISLSMLRMLVPLRKAVQHLGLHPNTLRKYADEGKIKTIKNEAGQRLFDVQSYINGATRASLICYCRVSSVKQRDDLNRQVIYMQSLYPEAEVIRDIGSGINFKRKGLCSLLDRLMRGDKLTLIVAHRDRLARFGFELIQYMVEQNGGKIVVLDSTV